MILYNWVLSTVHSWHKMAIHCILPHCLSSAAPALPQVTLFLRWVHIRMQSEYQPNNWYGLATDSLLASIWNGLWKRLSGIVKRIQWRHGWGSRLRGVAKQAYLGIVGSNNSTYVSTIKFFRGQICFFAVNKLQYMLIECVLCTLAWFG